MSFRIEKRDWQRQGFGVGLLGGGGLPNGHRMRDTRSITAGSAIGGSSKFISVIENDGKRWKIDTIPL